MVKIRLFSLFLTVVFLAVFSPGIFIDIMTGEESEGEIGPSIETIDPIYNFGRVYRGKTIHHTFTIRNSGDDHLKIEGISRDCGCTVAEVDRDYLAPGEEMSIDVKVDTKLLEGGETDKSVRLATNDRREPETVLTITGEILVTANHEPSRIELDGFEPGEKIPEQIVRIIPVEGYDLKVERVEVSSKFVTANLLEPDDSGEFRIAVNISSETTKNVIAAGIMAFTNLDEEPVLRIPVRVIVDQPFIIVPTSISFTGIDPDFDGTLAYNIVLKNNREEPLEILDIINENEFIECTLMTVEEGKKYRLNIALRAGFPESGFKAKVKVFTNSRKYPEREISIWVNLPRDGKGKQTGM
jgi:hypothetical protein